MASAGNSKTSAHSIRKSPTISPELLNTLKDVLSTIGHKLCALNSGLTVGESVELGVDGVQIATLFAIGGYNYVWVLEIAQSSGKHTHQAGSEVAKLGRLVPGGKLVVRLPCQDSLVPNQVLNEVAFKRFVSENLPDIPVPQVYHYEATDRPETSFVVEEFISGAPLSSIWMDLSLDEKNSMAQQLARLVIDLGGVEFAAIGGLNPADLSLAPTVEGSKLFKGRGQYHNIECYPIGPYKTTKEYMLACYDKEIYYYTHASEDTIDQDLFEDDSVEDFVKALMQKRETLRSMEMSDEPFTLVHGDLHGRNILVESKNNITAVLDWEFAGSFPLSETLSGGIDVIELNNEQSEEENEEWNTIIRKYIITEAKNRAWPETKIDLLMGDGNPELGRARMEMFP